MGGQLPPVNRGTSFGSIVRGTCCTDARTLTCIRLKSNKLFMFTSRRNNFCAEYSAPCPRFFANADVPLAAFCDLLVCVCACVFCFSCHFSQSTQGSAKSAALNRVQLTDLPVSKGSGRLSFFFFFFCNNGCLSWWIYLVLRCTVAIFLPLLRFLYDHHKVLVSSTFQFARTPLQFFPDLHSFLAILIPVCGVPFLWCTASARKNAGHWSVHPC